MDFKQEIDTTSFTFHKQKNTVGMKNKLINK